ncbi:MAG: pyridoxamine 5'-phosphate oxidase [Gammaproteobacteria bacterium]|nr:pyridoxamine 5'-phosphate oxidase [Gammaproteobacteria bacterium]
MTGEYDQRSRRREYGVRSLRRSDLAADPVELFARWLQAATDSGAKDATAMALATAGPDGAPSVRIVLLKHFDGRGFCWYSDDRSRKGAELAENPRASAVFYWRDFDRQVRISGSVEKLAAETSEAYFLSRPEESRFAAAASVQSAPVGDRAALKRAVADLRARFPGGGPPRPAQWGGYRLCPDEFEFWQGRSGRLHDRFLYVPGGEGQWEARRLQP